MDNIEKIYKITESENITKEQQIELFELLKPYQSGSIGLAQINPIVGDIEYNAKKIVKYINLAQNIGIETVIFPKLALIGYPIGDTVCRHPIIAVENIKWLHEIAKITVKTTAFVGFIDADENYTESIAILSEGKIHTIIKNNNENYHINGKNYEIICDETKTSNEKPDIIINFSSSISRRGAQYLKQDILSSISKKYSVPTICINQVGACDNFSFEGSSIVYDKDGQLFAKAKSFEEQFLIINPEKKLGKIYPMTDKTTTNNTTFSLNYEFDLERTYKTIIQGIKDYFNKTGFKRAVLGLSGGLDSSVCAVLLTDALGADNVLGISMPSKITSSESKNDAKELAHNLGINFAQAPIKEVVESNENCMKDLFENIEQKWDERYKNSYTSDNIQARERAMILWGVSNEFAKTLPIATSDKSEAYMGYATINGDMSGGFAPIADVTKTKLFALARWLNKNRPKKNTIPESIILKKPGAELAIDPRTNKPLVAEDALMPYEFLDEIIWRIENKKENYNDMLHSEFLYEKNNKLSLEQKTEWLNKFYRRMSSALYKWSIMPPSVIVDAHSINKSEYYQPITSSHINYKGTDTKEIAKKINNWL